MTRWISLHAGGHSREGPPPSFFFSLWHWPMRSSAGGGRSRPSVKLPCAAVRCESEWLWPRPPAFFLRAWSPVLSTGGGGGVMCFPHWDPAYGCARGRRGGRRVVYLPAGYGFMPAAGDGSETSN
ncbi:hypothetical protein H696_04678 [Fonticula alba]|uniref:Uncharacterized protein n=1 Tax=Fonticula alba TaxID=691883 RepID=A0A058Z289_FONAL|nr:hypothetical protein H696_04678 [Fonticula alba]KCV68389.1 hypothetical protein H696_04678 [Fonticula alba]|eukprot:XP_009496821.1 hypothetical protein H696_04678 [Fonticula alba]